jgi:hypothetical protein
MRKLGRRLINASEVGPVDRQRRSRSDNLQGACSGPPRRAGNSEARVLLMVIDKEPDAVTRALAPEQRACGGCCPHLNDDQQV